MVFGFLSRKQTAPQPLDLEPEPASASVSAQLRTPSPSDEAASASKPGSPFAPRHGVPQASPLPTEADPAPASNNPAELLAILPSIPPKTLHMALLARLRALPPDAATDPTLPLLAVLGSLAPPPKLHCVRCHSDYYEVENDERARACIVPHDDDTAEVEKTKPGSARTATYETLWGCCGKVVEGDGDQGPPDGWCYEGQHTTDVKRARFRADSSPHDDKLVSCLRRGCRGIRLAYASGSASAAPRRKRARREVNYGEGNTDDDHEAASDGDERGPSVDRELKEELRGLDIEDGAEKEREKKTPAKSKGKAKAKKEEAMDVDAEVEDGTGSSPAPKPRKPRGRPSKAASVKRKEEEGDGAVGDDDDRMSVASAKSTKSVKARAPSRPPDSAGPKKGRSLSAAPAQRKPRASKAKKAQEEALEGGEAGAGAGTLAGKDGEGDGEEKEQAKEKEKPKKRRKVA